MNILITGASGGIGSSILKRLDKNGNKIYAQYLNNLDSFPDMKNHVRIQCDFKDNQSIKDMMSVVEKDSVKLDAIINAVGIEEEREDPLDTVAWQNTLQVNLFGLIEVCRLGIPFLNKNGVIINISSIMGKHDIATPIDLTCYSVAKAALNKFTLNLAYNYADRLRAVTISPGYTETKMWDGFDEKIKGECVDDTPIKRFIDPAEIAQAVESVIENKAITGQDIIVDGGLGIRLIQ